MSYQPTKEQLDKLVELKKKGYVWDKQMSISCAGVVYKKGEDIWIFDLEGGIHHNSGLQMLLIKVGQ
jgi:hypothetical protein